MVRCQCKSHKRNPTVHLIGICIGIGTAHPPFGPACVCKAGTAYLTKLTHSADARHGLHDLNVLPGALREHRLGPNFSGQSPGSEGSAAPSRWQ